MTALSRPAARPAFPVGGYARLADRIGTLLGTGDDVLLVQAEAVVALEAAASSLARPGLVAVNVITSPYGVLFGTWLRRGGATVRDVIATPGLPVTSQAVAAALSAGPTPAVVALAHGEAASGIVNPLPEISALTRRAGAALVVDAVASVGGHPIEADGIDVVVIGPQKALGGPAAVSAVTVSDLGWKLIMEADDAVPSVLSLAELRRGWLQTGRGVLPGTPDPLVFGALDAALGRIEQEGPDRVIARHAAAARATRAGLTALGVPTWVPREQASALVTTTVVPDGLDRAELLAELRLVDPTADAGIGPGTERLIRLNHTGDRARLDLVRRMVLGYGRVLADHGIVVDLKAADNAILDLEESSAG